jgi:hypothetical protein
MKKKNPIAVALGRMAAGKAKTLTDTERQRRADALSKVRSKRWPEKKPKKKKAVSC